MLRAATQIRVRAPHSAIRLSLLARVRRYVGGLIAGLFSW